MGPRHRPEARLQADGLLDLRIDKARTSGNGEIHRGEPRIRTDKEVDIAHGVPLLLHQEVRQIATSCTRLLKIECRDNQE